MIGFIIYSYIYFSDSGKGIYISQAYIDKSYRKKEYFKKLVKELRNQEKDCKHIICFVAKDNRQMTDVMKAVNFNKSDYYMYYK